MATSSTEVSSGPSPALRSRGSRTRDPQPSAHLWLVIASSVLVGVCFVDLTSRGLDIGAWPVGTLAAISFGTKLLGAVPLGMLSNELSDLMSWVACLADARPAAVYSEWLTDTGSNETIVENHDEALTGMNRGIGTRLFATEVLTGLGKLDVGGIDLPAAKRLTKQAMAAMTRGRLGYAIVAATKSP